MENVIAVARELYSHFWTLQCRQPTLETLGKHYMVTKLTVKAEKDDFPTFFKVRLYRMDNNCMKLSAFREITSPNESLFSSQLMSNLFF